MRWAPAFACLSALACREPPTELVVVIDSELRVGDEVDEVRLTIERSHDGAPLGELAAPLTGAAARSLPVTFSLELDGRSPGPLDIILAASLRGKAVLRREARALGFAEGRVLAVRLDLLRACLDASTCPAAPPVEPWPGHPEGLDEWRRRTGGEPMGRDGGVQDSAGIPDGGIINAGDDGGSPCLGETCSCAEGRRCDQTCDDDEECSSTCRDDGTRCEVNGRAAESASLTCSARARCSLEGGADTDTRAVCEDEAWCDVGCSGPSCQLDCRAASCRLRTRDRASIVRVSCTKRADCALVFDAGDDVEVICNGSSCGVTCRVGARCSVKCIGGASCLLRCDDPNGCELTNCPGKSELTCAPGVTACGRTCP